MILLKHNALMINVLKLQEFKKIFGFIEKKVVN